MWSFSEQTHPTYKKGPMAVPCISEFSNTFVEWIHEWLIFVPLFASEINYLRPSIFSRNVT